MNYEKTLEKLQATKRGEKDNSLNRMRSLMLELKNPEKNLKIIHVAGTNGKGSVSKILNDVLIKNGYNVGLFSSPYIYDFRERIQINNNLIEKENVMKFYNEVLDAEYKIMKKGYTKLSQFEVITAMSFLYFKEKDVDLAVIEVGIGGLYDSTNIINSPVISVITSIDYDHMDMLGNTLESIAINKAGIMKGNDTISSNQKAEVKKTLVYEAKKNNSNLFFVRKEDVTYIKIRDYKQELDFTFLNNTYRGYLKLLGTHQLENLNTSIKALEVLHSKGYKITVNSIKEAIRSLRWPGRMDIVSKEPFVLLDGAHNISGAHKLKESLDLYFKDKDIILIIGILKSKNFKEISKVLARDTKLTISVTPDIYKGLDSKELFDLIDPGVNKAFSSSYDDAIDKALEVYDKNSIIVVSGSLYILADIEKKLKDHKEYY